VDVNEFITLDSGEREEYPTGMRRDVDHGKPDYTLIDADYLRRWAALMTRGAIKYGKENWRLAETEEELTRFKASAFRHLMQWLNDETDEDHSVAVSFNLAAAEMVKEKLRQKGNNKLGNTRSDEGTGKEGGSHRTSKDGSTKGKTKS
jgi:hypothetical protein